MTRTVTIFLLLLVVIAALVVTPIQAQNVGGADIDAGVDLFETPGDGNTWFMIESDNPIPPDFFDPGSDPFSGTVYLQGLPFTTTPADALRPVDTAVRRIQSATSTGTCPASETIDIAIVALSLKSSSPITVTYNGGTSSEQWDVNVYLSTNTAQQTGTMTINKVCPAGGTFDATLYVTPRIVFTRVSDGATREIDGVRTDTFTTVNGRWVYNDGSILDLVTSDGTVTVDHDGNPETPEVGLPMSTQFLPSVEQDPCVDCNSTGGGKVKKLTEEQARLAKHGIKVPKKKPRPRGFPCAGDDTLTTILLTDSVVVDGFNLGPQQFSGPTVVRRGEPHIDATGTSFVPTEIVDMQLSGKMGFIRIGNPSTGRVDGAEPGVDYPARGFFDVYAVIQTPLGPLFTYNPTDNTDPARMQANSIQQLPPCNEGNNCFDGNDEYSQNVKRLYDAAGNVRGNMYGVLHCPNFTTCPPPPPPCKDTIPPPVTDIGIQFCCVTDTLKVCTDTVYTNQPWHVLFEVVNKGRKQILNWSFDIFLMNQLIGVQETLKLQVPGPVPLAPGEKYTVQWTTNPLFSELDKGPWQVDVRVAVKDPSNPDPDQSNNFCSTKFDVVNKLISDLGIDVVCVTDSNLICANQVFVGQFWGLSVCVTNKGQKKVLSWAQDLIVYNQITGETIYTRTTTFPIPLQPGQQSCSFAVGLPLFDSTQKGMYQANMYVRVLDPGNPDANTANNCDSIKFPVENKLLVTDIGIQFCCVTDTLKLCRDTLYVDQPWHVSFGVVNKGEKQILNWSYDILLTNQQTGIQTVLKQQEAGSLLAPGEKDTVQWVDSLYFIEADKGPWQVDIRVDVKDPSNPDTNQSNNSCRTKFVVVNKPVSVDEDFVLPTDYVLHQNYPNPFNPSTTIQFDLPEAAIVSLKIYNIFGQEVAILLNHQPLPAGKHAAQFHAASLANGTYIYRILANSFRDQKVMTFLK